MNGARADWTILEEAGVQEQITKVARSRARYGNYERADVEQELRILLATKAEAARAAMALGPGALNDWLWQRHRDTSSRHRVKVYGKGQVYVKTFPSSDEDMIAAYLDAPRFALHSTPGGAYSPVQVAEILPSLWTQQPTGCQRTPDGDMPRTATRDAASASTAWATRADIRRAWRLAPLTYKQRRALFLRFAGPCQCTYGEIADHEGIKKQSAEERVNRGISCIVRWLNGEEVKDYGTGTLTNAA